MKKHASVNIGLLIGTIILLISSIVAPMVIGYNVRIPNKVPIAKNFDCYHISEIPIFIQHHISKESNTYDYIESEKIRIKEETIQLLEGPPIDSHWPMYCHDVRHTGRSPYSTANNSGYEKWRLYIESGIKGGIVVADDGTIYYGYGDLYAAYPNGTIKWIYDTHGTIQSVPAINEDGTIYVGIESASDKYFYAINPNGTLKWRHGLPGSVYSSSPAIGDDGTIYFGLECGYPWYGYIYALYPNGTLRWRYKTDNVVYSSPALGEDDTIYCGSHDGNLYALYSNNGSLKWKFPTSDYIRVSPCIADDGTIYFVSIDSFLYAVYPNGSLNWKIDVGAGTSPTIGQDGTIYAGYTKLHAINPTNGSVKWKFDIGGTMRGGTPCNSIDGTIYVGTSDGGEIIAINPDGTEKWRKTIDICECAPAIGEDGTVYVGSYLDDGYLFAFGSPHSDVPSAPEIDGETSGRAGTEYEYTFNATDPDGDDVKYYIDWGDNTTIEWTDFNASGKEVMVKHTWSKKGDYTIISKAQDIYGAEGPEGTLPVTIPKNKALNFNFNLLGWLFDRFPMLSRLLNLS